MILTPQQLKEVTGYATKSKQAQWLTAHGWTFHLNRFNAPVVDLDYYRIKMGASNEQNYSGSTQPNWAALA